ncbi:MAG TPA: hypothetical protein VK843_17160 [Planctomycetota bacterium]|nr:hypothetical protein [Planctomycetota bacterium]
MLHTSSMFLPAMLLGVLARPSVTPQAPVNEPPVVFQTYTANFTCQGAVTVIPLDGSAVYDPEGDPLTFQWTSGCPGQSIAESASQSTTLSIDTSSSCTVDCSVRLRVSDGVNDTFARFFIHISGPMQAELDMHPGSCPNPVQIGGGGVVPAALVGTLGFDVGLVDRPTLRLARADGQGLPVPPIHFVISDVAVPFPDDGCNCHTLTHDGLPDLALKFNKQSMVAMLQLAQEADKSYLPVVLTGRLLTGEEFSAKDCIRVQK